MNVLIFPATTFEAVCYARQLRKEGHFLVGAASVASEFNSEDMYDKEEYIPYIIDNNFMNKLTKIIHQYNITHFWTSINSVYSLTKKSLTELGVEFLSCDPMSTPLIPIDLILSEVKNRRDYLDILSSNFSLPVINEPLLHSVLYNSFSVPGQSYFDKSLTICQIFKDIPAGGDIVEIGVLWGRSATLFSLLSNIHNKGNLLCIDPWPHDGVTQNTNSLLDKFSQNLDSSSSFTIFAMKLAAIFPSRVNYLREYSDDALLIYKNLKGKLSSVEFGQVDYYQTISLLHIDGNHGLEAVKSDVEKWCPLVIPGGWIIFDDYNWNYGEGPSIVVDKYLIDHAEHIACAFFCGGAMFVKLRC